MDITETHLDLTLANADEAPAPVDTSSAEYLIVKSGFDAVLASLLLVLASPVILLLLILTKATSRGPALFKQVRVGRDGREYSLYKIRSMAHDCERLSGPKWSTANDPRITPLGRFLRRTHLDDLPQLWNVVRGEMSLIGPRPERPVFIAKLEGEVPRYRERLAVKPGITGLAQILLPPDEDLDDVRHKVACDLSYIRRMGPMLDLRILVITALKMMGLPYEVTRKAFELSMFFDQASTPDAMADEPGKIPIITPPRRMLPETFDPSIHFDQVSVLDAVAAVRRSPRNREAGRFSYIIGLFGAVLFMAAGFGPAWMGFIFAFLPASLLAAWATTSHA